MKSIEQMINWQHPLVGGNPFLMPFMWQMAIVKTLMEAQYVGIGSGSSKQRPLAGSSTGGTGGSRTPHSPLPVVPVDGS